MFHNKRKTIALFLERPTSEFQNKICQGVLTEAEKQGCNVAVFATYGNYGKNERHFIGDQCLWDLPPYEDLDGVILMLDTMNEEFSRRKILNHIEKRCHCPIVSIREMLEGVNNLLVDNKTCMDGIIEHFVVEHGMKHLCFMTGPKGRWDAEERLASFVKKMEQYHLSVNEHQYFYGDFWKNKGKEAVDWFLAGEQQPEAIICANDHMAIAVTSELIRRGYAVPKDICVSGYDGLEDTLSFTPSVTTATVPFYDMGVCAVDTIVKKQACPEESENIYFQTIIKRRESCGCIASGSKESRELRQQLYESGLVSGNREMQFHFMSITLGECLTLDSTPEHILRYAYNIEGLRDYCICLREDLYTMNQFDTYTDKMELRVGIKNMQNMGSHLRIPFSKRELLPADMTDDASQLWYFAPLHFQDNCFGYEAFRFQDTKTTGNLYQYWNIILGNQIQDMYNYYQKQQLIEQLEDMYNKDALTGIYNLRGFREYEKTILEEAKAEQNSVFMAIIDLDGLKQINDSYGHAEGDYAIRKLAEAIGEVCPTEMVRARIGGDEFRMIGKGITKAEGDSYLKALDEYLEEFNCTSEKEYAVHASYGYACCIPKTTGAAIERLNKESDEMMYANKIMNKTSRGEPLR